jgi:hypothetical protein
VLNSSGTHRSFPQVSVPRKPECSDYQTRLFGFGVWVLEWILYESTSIASPGYCYNLLLFIKCLEINWIGFVVNSLTKLDCPVLAVLIPQQVLLNFRIAYSTPSGQHQGTFTKLLGLSGPQKAQYVVNTIIYLLTRAKMARSLIDTGGGYHLRASDNHDPLPTLPIQVLHFLVFASPGHTININIKPLLEHFQKPLV